MAHIYRQVSADLTTHILRAHAKAIRPKLFFHSQNISFTNFKLVDNGLGFDIESESKGRGLKNMKARAKKINAKLVVQSDSNGTSISLNRIPHMRDDFIEKEV